MQKINSRSKPPLIPLNGPVRHTVDIIMIVIGSLITAIAFNIFMLPNRIASGGVSGLSVLAQSWLGAEPAFTQWALNIPLFVLGVLFLGKQYGVRSLLGSFVLPLFIYFTRDFPVPTHNPLLASIYSGIGVGLGLGLVFRGRGSTGGLTILAQIIQKVSGLSFSMSVVLLDGTVITLAAFVLGMEQALYALIGLFVTGRVINTLEVGFSNTKVAYIISDQTEEISQAILHDLDRGLTKLNAQGGYTGDHRTVLMVVVGQNEITRLKAIVRSVDPGAFVIITEAHEVLGEGFKREA
ncbi:YitT family protein [Paenibacillus wynnii]|uniref:Membrane protein n=1 Tax=Paenibacillus wynnii TaxID=268407 RepID=A0A098MEE8_9BACL|nr:YitT family protein [Paenibacillus wynnii]KGE20423.1 membrane protein [Paenibacillus wynnii]